MGSLKEEMKTPAEVLVAALPRDASDAHSVRCSPRGECLGSCDITAGPGEPDSHGSHQTHSPASLPQLHVSTPSDEEEGGGLPGSSPDWADETQLDSVCVGGVTQTGGGPAAVPSEVGSAPEQDLPSPPDTTEVGEPSHMGRDSQGEELQHSDGGETNMEEDLKGEKELERSSTERPVPGSPARLQHIQTQVSLEVVQCHSVATSPMTPPEGAGAFHFLYSSTKLGAVAAEPKEFRSVATAPMTPRTPTGFLTFSEVPGREKKQSEVMDEGMEEQVEEVEEEQMKHVSASDLDHVKVYPQLELAPAAKCTAATKVTEETAPSSDPSPETSSTCPQMEAAETNECCNFRAEEPIEDKQHQPLQRVETMDQDITILVTHHDSPEEEEGEEEEANEAGEQTIVSAEPELWRSNKHGELNAMLGNSTEVNSAADVVATVEQASTATRKNMTTTELSQNSTMTDINTTHTTQKKNFSPHSSENIQTETDIMELQSLNQIKSPEQAEEKRNKKIPCSIDGTGTGPGLHQVDHVPGSPARLQHIQTQVSLEVVQCHSVATSPMTPPEGAGAFHFLYSSTKLGGISGETKNGERQESREVEYRSVATAPMTPRTPTGLIDFPEITGRERKQSEQRVVEEKGGMEEKVEAVRKMEKIEEKEGWSVVSQKLKTDVESETETINKGKKITLVTTEEKIEEKEEGTEGNTVVEMKKPVKKESEERARILEPAEEKPEEIEQEKPEEIEQEKPEEIEQEKPEKIKQEKPEKTEKETSVKIEQEKPEEIEQEKPEKTEKETSEKIKQEKPEEIEQEKPEEIEQETSEKIKQEKPEEIEQEKPEEIEQETSEKIEQEKPEKTEQETSVKIEQETSEKIEQEKPEKTEQETSVKIEQEKPEKTAEEKPEKTAEEKPEKTAEEKPEKTAEEKPEETTEELVQEVRWDEKGMTWEVYGAVVEVAVLGSAIQKHLEKQVKKHRKQPSSALPPPPPLSPSATPLPSTPPPAGGPSLWGSGKGQGGRKGEREGKRGRRRRNPFRLLLQNMQQPHCCSRAHSTE